MDSTVLAGIIGGCCTVGGSIAAVIATRVLDNPMGFKRHTRQASLAGHWDGTVQQEGISEAFRITFRLTPMSRTIRGEGEVRLVYDKRAMTEPLTFFGGFVHDRFLKLEYEMQAQPGSVQFGFTLLELSPDGQTLSGPFLGYGALITRGMVSGTLQLHKRGSIPHFAASAHTTS